jgi:hypothetical protein
MITLGEIAEWILVHRKNKVFKNYTLGEIVSRLAECVKDSTMVCMTEVDGSIVGVACAKKDTDKHTMFVYDVLSIKKGAAKNMLQWLKANYPGYTLCGNRGGTLTVYNNLDKLINRM